MNCHMKSWPVFVNGLHAARPSRGADSLKGDDVVIPDGPARLGRIRLEDSLLDAGHDHRRDGLLPDRQRFAIDPRAKKAQHVRAHSATLSLDIDSEEHPRLRARPLNEKAGDSDRGPGGVSERRGPAHVVIDSISGPVPRPQRPLRRRLRRPANVGPCRMRSVFGVSASDGRRVGFGDVHMIPVASAPPQFHARNIGANCHLGSPPAKRFTQGLTEHATSFLARCSTFRHGGVSHESF